jgi:hypothetical protein
MKMNTEEAKGHGPEGDTEHADRPDDRGRKDDDHGHGITIIVNGRENVWTEDKISYEQLVAIANLPLPGGPSPGFTITYHDGPHDRPDGTLTAGHSVKVKDGMVFNVTPTNQS